MRRFGQFGRLSGRVLTLLAIAIACAAFALLIVILRHAAAPPDATAIDLPRRITGAESQLTDAHRHAAPLSDAATRRQQQSLKLLDAVERTQDQLSALTKSLDSLSAPAQMEKAQWVEYQKNPVFTRDGPAAHPFVVYDVAQFGEGTNGAFYKMWYDQCDDGVTPMDKTWIGLAVSPDGVRWTDLGELKRPGVDRNNPEDWRQYIGHPCVLYDVHGFGRGGLPYRLYYPGWDGIRLEESRDGLTWQPADAPIFTHDDVPEEPTFRGPMHGLYASYDDGGTPTDPRDDMFFGWIDYSGRPFIVCSRDGVRWQMPGTLLFDGFGAGMVTSVFSVHREAGGIMHIFYSYGDNAFESPAPAGEGIAYLQARTLNQRTLPLMPARPIFHASDKVAWRSVVTMCPCVVYDADAFSGHGDRAYYKMWYHGVGPDHRSGIGYATLQGAVPVEVKQ